jgi:hypothetical protein
MSTLPFQGGVIFRTFASDSVENSHRKQLRLPVVNETHTNSYIDYMREYRLWLNKLFFILKGRKLRLPLSHLKKYKTMDTPKTVNIFNSTFRLSCSQHQSSFFH